MRVAIVGVDIRVPGANNERDFLSLVLDNREALTEVDLPSGGLVDEPTKPWVTRRPILQDVEQFDPEQFSLSFRDSVLMDPQHRMFLLACRSVLHQAGHDYRRQANVGVFASCDESQYQRHILSQSKQYESPIFEKYLSGDRDFLATRISYHLGLSGPAFSVQSACSSSLVAIHLAAQSLAAGECDAALAGGVSLQLPQGQPYRYHSEMIYSRDGSCRPFDSKADGTNLSSGLGVVFLKRYDDALRDEDRIIAVLRGTGVNNDGRRKMSFSSPSPAGQQDALLRALRNADIDVETLKFVETHGTATKLGDPVEFSSLSSVISKLTSKKNFCALSGIKANVGHLGYASGVVGFIKAALCLEQGIAPGMTNFESPSKFIRLEGSPFVIDKLPHRFEDGPAAAVVSSLGAGGTNAFAVIERQMPQDSLLEEVDAGYQLIAVTDDQKSSAERNANSVSNHLLEKTVSASCAAAVGMKLAAFGGFRAAVVVAPGSHEVIAAAKVIGKRPKVCFVLPGQGNQRPGAFQSLYQRNAAFRSAFDRCDELFAPILQTSLAAVMWSGSRESELLLEETKYVQAVVFTLEYSLIAALADAGLVPDRLVGHSFGEIVALAVAGVLSLTDAVTVVSMRGNCLNAAPDGRMLFVAGLSYADISHYLVPGVYVAAKNGPRQFVLSGEPAAILGVAAGLHDKGFKTTLLKNTRQFHTPHVKDCLEPLAATGDSIKLMDGGIDIVSTVTGRPLLSSDLASFGNYLVEHASQPVLFDDALRVAAEDTDIFLEIGDSFICNHLLAEDRVALRLVDKNHADEYQSFLSSTARLWTLGVGIDLGKINVSRRPKSVVPGYAFALKRCWPDDLEPSETSKVGATPPVAQATTVRATDDIDAVITVFRNTLGLASIGATSDFFDHGGHSLSAISLCEDLKLSCGFELSLNNLLALRTPQRICEFVAAAPGSVPPPGVQKASVLIS